MGIGWVFLSLGALWLLQLLLAWHQAQRFMRRARALRRQGKVSIGASPRKVRGRAYVALAVGPDDRVTAAEALRGITVFANARPVPDLVGLTAAELAGGAPVPGLTPMVLAAARSAAAVVHPDRGSVNGQRPPNIPEGVGSSG
jgi:DNA-binding transcriptional regulator of glucitol operon